MPISRLLWEEHPGSERMKHRSGGSTQGNEKGSYNLTGSLGLQAPP